MQSFHSPVALRVQQDVAWPLLVRVPGLSDDPDVKKEDLIAIFNLDKLDNPSDMQHSWCS